MVPNPCRLPSKSAQTPCMRLCAFACRRATRWPVSGSCGCISSCLQKGPVHRRVSDIRLETAFRHIYNAGAGGAHKMNGAQTVRPPQAPLSPERYSPVKNHLPPKRRRSLNMGQYPVKQKSQRQPANTRPEARAQEMARI